MSEETAWEELQKVAATTPTSAKGANTTWSSVLAWWNRASLWQRVAVGLAGVAFVAFGITAAVAAFSAAPHDDEHAVAAVFTSTPTPTPVPTATPTATPTPQPQLVVWSSAGDCAYVRPNASIDNKPLVCIANGTVVVDLGERQEANGFTWARVQYPTSQGYAATGWMAVGAVAWDFQASHTTGDEKIPLYKDDLTTVQMYLPPHTPFVVVQDEGNGWTRVMLPNRTAGYIKSSALK